MHGRDVKAAAALRFFFGHFDDAHRDGKLMHDWPRGRIEPAERGERGLAQADAPIVWWNLVIRPDRHGTQTSDSEVQIFEKQLVLEDAA